MILVGEGRTEEGHHAVPGELVDRPLVTVDLIHEDLEAPVHDLVDLPGVELLGKGRVVCHVGKEHRHHLVLALDTAPRAEDLVSEELGGVRLGLGEVERRGFLLRSEALSASFAEDAPRLVGLSAL